MRDIDHLLSMLTLPEPIIFHRVDGRYTFPLREDQGKLVCYLIVPPPGTFLHTLDNYAIIINDGDDVIQKVEEGVKDFQRILREKSVPSER